MDEDALHRFARQIDADPEQIMDRWEGRPDLVIDDIFRVRDLDTGQVRDLELFDVQREFVHAYFYGDVGTLNAYKGRRIGYSFIAVACFLLEGMFYPKSFYPLVSRTLSQAKDRISDIEELIANAKIEIPTEKTNTDYIELWNGTSYMAYSADSDTSRGGDSARAVLMDEMAFIEDEEEAYEAFGAFLALGKNRKMVEISTPNTKNDLFMREHRSGSPDGKNGIISIKQPTFKNADQIDINTSLYDQELVPARPNLNISNLETQRKTDPEGFAQEYLCRPISDEYGFFDEETIVEAQKRSQADDYERGLDAYKPGGVRRVMGVDIGINRDDTVLSAFDHYNSSRQQKELIVVDDDWLRSCGIRDPDRANANHIAEFVNYIDVQMDCDLIVMDRGGVGQTFDRIIREKVGRKLVGFDFSDKEAVSDMMGDMNVALRDGDISLVTLDDGPGEDRLFDELSAIVKKKRDSYAKPKFTGKDHSSGGKDDTAMATVLSAFPPTESNRDPLRPADKEREVEDVTSRVSQKSDKPDGERNANYGAVKVSRASRTRKNKYSSRRSRR